MSANTNAFAAATVAGAVAAALGALSSPAAAQAEKEKCYGVALKGQNDCASASHHCAGHGTVDYDGKSYKLVPKGTCLSITTPYGPGSLKPIKRPA